MFDMKISRRAFATSLAAAPYILRAQSGPLKARLKIDTERVIGRPMSDVLGLRFDDGQDHVATVLEWGVRALGKPVEVHAEGDLPAKAVADLFPAYDDDGGLLLVLTPSK